MSISWGVQRYMLDEHILYARCPYLEIYAPRTGAYTWAYIGIYAPDMVPYPWPYIPLDMLADHILYAQGPYIICAKSIYFRYARRPYMWPYPWTYECVFSQPVRKSVFPRPVAKKHIHMLQIWYHILDHIWKYTLRICYHIRDHIWPHICSPTIYWQIYAHGYDNILYGRWPYILSYMLDANICSSTI